MVGCRWLPSLLIASGLDVKTVQARVRHASVKTTLTYGHLWPDKDESSKAAVAVIFTERPDSAGTVAETSEGPDGESRRTLS